MKDVSGFLRAAGGLLTASYSRSRTQLLDPMVQPGPDYRNASSDSILAHQRWKSRSISDINESDNIPSAVS